MLNHREYSILNISNDFRIIEVRMIEANTNPCLEEPCSLLRQLVPRMCNDMLKIVLDPLFSTSSNQVYEVSGYPDDE